MSDDTLYVTMLGTFSLRWKDGYLDDHSNRMRKVWLLLAYLIYTRNDRTTQENYLELLRGGGEDGDDPAGRLKSLLYRTRVLLDQLGSRVGHQLIIRRGGTYAWNTGVPLHLDVEEFDRLCRAAESAENEDARLERYLQALALYGGDFLPKLSTELWIMPIAAYYHQLYLDTAEHALELLEARERWDEATPLCRRALAIEPYSEPIAQHLMRCCLATGDRAGALAAYEDISKRLFDAFGVIPSEESHRLSREASRETSDCTVPIDDVQAQLRESGQVKGALYCEYDFFKLLYQVQARTVARSGEAVHIALLSIGGSGRRSPSRRSLDLAAENLKQIVLSNLRQGDIVSRCSASQLVLMLPQANYENSCAVCQRIIKAFCRQYPHSPVEVRYGVQPLEPAAPAGWHPVGGADPTRL